jgi:hypothetical protein
VGNKQHATSVLRKTVQAMIAAQDGLEQPLFLGTEGVEGAAAAFAKTSRLVQGVQLLAAGTRHGHGRQGLEVTLVAGTSNGVVVVEIGDAFVHGAPEHLGFPLPRAATTDLELTGLVDDGFDAEDEAELVVHFQPIVFHPMLDTGTGMTTFFEVAKDFAIETRM